MGEDTDIPHFHASGWALSFNVQTGAWLVPSTRFCRSAEWRCS